MELAHANRLVVTPHPLSLDGQRSVPVVLADGDTLASLLAAHGVHRDVAWLVEIDGCYVPEPMWARTRPKAGLVIACRQVPQKDALRLVATVALFVYAPQVAISLGVSGAAASALTAFVVFSGTALINRLLGPKPIQPSTASQQNAGGDQSYSLTGGRNTARLYEPMALVLGEPYAVPDLANQPYSTFGGEDQYLTQAFHCGVNCQAYSALRIGDNPIANYDGVTEYREGFAGMAGTGMPNNAVDTVAGGLLDAPTGSGPTVTRTSSPDTLLLAVDIEASLYQVNQSTGAYEALAVDVSMEYRAVGSGTWLPYQGASAVVPLANASTKPLRQTYWLQVAQGQYEVRLQKMTANVAASNQANTVQFSALKSYQVDLGNYAGQARFALNIKASGQLNGSLDTVNCLLVAQPMPYWNGSAWVTATSRANGLSNPGAQILLLARGVFDGSGKLLAGLGWADARIDIEGLKRFMVWCAAKGFTFDLYLQANTSIWDLLEAIAQAGLGMMGWPGGKLGVLWLADDAPLEGVVNMSSMKAKSFSVDYATVQTADELVLSYFDRNRSHTWQDVRIAAPGVTAPQNSSRLQLLGVTTEAHAATIGRQMMGQNVYMRKAINFEQDLEHIAYQRTTVLGLSHDLTQWGYGGRVQAAANASGTVTLTLDDVVPAVSPSGATTRFIGLRLRGERQMRVFGIASFTGSSRTVTLATAWPGGVPVPGDSAGNPARDCLWMYDFKATPGQKVVVTSVAPQGNLAGAQVSVTPLDDAFWTYVLTGAYTAPVSGSLLATDPTASRLQVTEQLVRQGNTYAVDLTLSFDVGGPYDHAHVYGGLAGEPLRKLGDTRGRAFTWRGGLDDVWVLELRPFSSLRAGTPAALTYTVLGLAVPPENYDVFLLDTQPDGTRQFSFAYTSTQPPLDLAGAEIRYLEGTGSPAWADMKPLRGDSSAAAQLDDGFFTRSPVETNLLLAGPYTFALRARDTTKNLAATPLYITGTLPDRRLGSVLVEFDELAEGWPGTLTSCHVQDGVIEADDSTTWATLPATWNLWTRWNLAPASPIAYVGVARDLGVALVGQINSTVDADGTVVQELRTSPDGSTWSSWGAAAAPFNARWIQLRLTVTATGGAPVPVVRSWRYNVGGKVKKDQLNDVNIAALSGAYRLGTGDVRAPIVNSYSVISRATVAAIQDSNSGWTWLLVDRSTTTGPRFKFFKAGVAADPALVDFYIEGY